MSEFELAAAFVQGFAEATAAAGGDGRRLCDEKAFRSFYRGLGIRPTPERLELVRDLGAVLAEELVRMDLPAAQAAERAGCTTISAESLVDGLERHGWRLAFLAGQVRG